jgi:hypothetical protein
MQRSLTSNYRETDVAKKHYETTSVEVPRGERIAKIAFALLFCVCGLVLLIRSLLLHKPDDSDVTLAAFGALILAIGVIALIKFKATHEPQLTERGKAAKAADDTARKSRTEASNLFVGFVAFICAIVYFAPAVFDAFGNEVRLYPVQCPTWDYSTATCTAHKWKARGIRYFTVYSSQQIVIASYPDDTVPPTRYYNCAVVDRLNWACTVDAKSDSARVTMTHGVFVDAFDDPSTRYTSRWRWWNIKWSSDD